MWLLQSSSRLRRSVRRCGEQKATSMAIGRTHRRSAGCGRSSGGERKTSWLWGRCSHRCRALLLFYWFLQLVSSHNPHDLHECMLRAAGVSGRPNQEGALPQSVLRQSRSLYFTEVLPSLLSTITHIVPCFDFSSSLVLRLSYVMPGEFIAPARCNGCQDIFDSKSQAEDHARRAGHWTYKCITRICTQCMKTFAKNEDQQQHINATGHMKVERQGSLNGYPFVGADVTSVRCVKTNAIAVLVEPGCYVASSTVARGAHQYARHGER